MESARIDGASELRIFVRLILPLGLPAIASLAIFQFLWTWNDLIVALTFGQNVQPITVAIFSNLRQFGANIDLIAPASFISLIVPARGVLRVPALLRPGAARRLGEVSGGSGRARSSAAASPASSRTRRSVHGGSAEDVTVFDAAGADPARGLAAARGVDPPAADALGERRPLPADVVPGARGARRLAPAQPVAARRRASATATTRRSRSSSSTSRSCARRIGWDDAVVPTPRRADPRGRRRVRARRARHRSATCSSPPGTRGPERPGGARRRPAGRPRLRAARVRRRRRRRRRRDGGGDRVAERARRRRAGHLGAAPRAAAPAAQRARGRCFSRRGLARASTPRRRPSARRSSAALLAPSYPPGREWDEPLERAGRAVPGRGGGERRRAGDLRDRLPARASAHDPLLARLVAEHGLETHGHWIVLAPDCTVPGAHGRRADALARRGRRRSGPTRPPTRSSGAKYAAHGFLRRVQACRTR